MKKESLGGIPFINTEEHQFHSYSRELKYTSFHSSVKKRISHIMAWRSSGTNNTEMVDKLVSKSRLYVLYAGCLPYDCTLCI
jgi:hypothetical protein